MGENLIIEDKFESKEFLTPLQHNLIKTLQSNGPITRRELVKYLNIPRTTIYDNLLKLQKRKIIEKFTRNNGKRGRPLVFWKIKL
ncbi:MAG: helix-turn-helix domain-containing protein [Candidatus Heimdallarchaeota archaeon]